MGKARRCDNDLTRLGGGWRKPPSRLRRGEAVAGCHVLRCAGWRVVTYTADQHHKPAGTAITSWRPVTLHDSAPRQPDVQPDSSPDYHPVSLPFKQRRAQLLSFHHLQIFYWPTHAAKVLRCNASHSQLHRLVLKLQ